MGGGLKKLQYPKRGFEKVFDSRKGFLIFLYHSKSQKSQGRDSTLIRFHPIAPPFRS